MQRFVAACVELFKLTRGTPVTGIVAWLDKDVLTLIALFRQMRNALNETTWCGFRNRKSTVDRRPPLRAERNLFWQRASWWLVIGLFAIGPVFAAEIFTLPPGKIPPGINSQMSFPERADSVRKLIPWENTPLPDPLQLAQVPNRPDWAGTPTQDLPSDLQQPQQSLPLQPSNAAGSNRNRRITVMPRGGGATDFRMIPRGAERAFVVNTPTQITVLGGEEGAVEISADRIVVWTDKNVQGLGNLSASRVPVEFYMEGNIELRQAGTLAIAERMYYNAWDQTGVILEGEIFGESRQQQGVNLEDIRMPWRLKGDVLQQVSPSQFVANNAAFTLSRLGVPVWWLESDSLSVDTGSTSVIDQFANRVRQGGPQLGGELDTQLGPGGFGDDQGEQSLFSGFDRLQVSSQNTRVYLGGVPIFNWPSFTTDLARNPSLYLDRIRVGSDSVYGQQLLTRWNNYQLLGITPIEGTKWTTTLDLLTDRGLGFGSDFDYEGDSFFGRPAISRGFLHTWFINDNGFDNLGFDRRRVRPEEDFRGRIYGRHQHLTPSGLQVTAEIGWLSDRNFEEQYFEEEFDLFKDKDTRLEIKQFFGSSSLSIAGNVRLNDFHTQTEWLPRVDHFDLGRALFGNRATLYGHSQAGYARLRTAEAPTNAIDAAKWDPMAWDRESEGLRAVTRQELDVPLQLGPIKVVPYLLGEAGYWQNDINGDDATRFLGQAGIRSSLLFWKADPTIQNELFNLNGIAHKLVLDSEFLWADSNQDYLDLPLYDALDDDSVEFFRRRFPFDSFGLTFGDDVPLRADERNFAFRSGMQRFVTAQSTEIADDLMMARFGVRQRFQTKRGEPGYQRIVDVLTFDVETTLFPDADRDNFGETLGPLTYSLRYHPGDRLTFMSDGYFDFFEEGLRTASLGVALSRPGRSQYFVGIRSIEGPISSNVLTSSVEYLLSPKWKIEYGSAVDLSSTGNIGQRARIVRIGESFLVGLGAYYDASRNNFGFRFDIALRGMRSKMAMINSRPIAPVGVFGFE